MSATLVTGAVGFIGYHVCEALLARGERVVGVDDLNDYYPVSLKLARKQRLLQHAGFEFLHCDIRELPEDLRFDRVIHLAAMAGVRNSTLDPARYCDVNVLGTQAVLSRAVKEEVRSFVYASSSSVKRITSIYGATKHACEDLAEAFASIHGLPCIGLRYHTVYGPWGRPDMALWKFVRAAFDGKPIDLYNSGDMGRDFSYIADVVQATVLAHDIPPVAGRAVALDIGRGHTRRLLDAVRLIEEAVGQPIERRLLPMQAGDVGSTLAYLADAKRLLGYQPTWDLEQGIPEFVAWYRQHGGGL